MRARPFLGIDKITFIGGRSCLDFVNTTGNRSGTVPRERLTGYCDLIVFGKRTGLLRRTRGRAAGSLVAVRPRTAERALARMLRLREVLYRLFLSALQRRPASAADLRAFNAEHQDASRHRRLTWSQAAPAWTLAAPADELEVMRWDLVASAAELLGSADLARVRKCGECDWLFLDTSKNQRRRWCKKTCGDRVKARRYYRRKRRSRAALRRPRRAGSRPSPRR